MGIAGEELVDDYLLEDALEHEFGHEDIAVHVHRGEEPEDPVRPPREGGDRAHQVAVPQDVALHDVLRLHQLVHQSHRPPVVFAEVVQAPPDYLYSLSRDVVVVPPGEVLIDPGRGPFCLFCDELLVI